MQNVNTEQPIITKSKWDGVNKHGAFTQDSHIVIMKMTTIFNNNNNNTIHPGKEKAEG